MKKIDPTVNEAIQTLNMKDGPSRRRLLSSAGLVSASAAAAGLLAACSSSTPSTAAAKNVAGNFPKTPAWQFWYVNHVTTNPFFVPTQYGFQDAAALLGLPTPKWGGSQTSLASEMVSYFNTAIAAKAAGISYAGIDATSFTTPVKNAMNAGIPVLSYNADGLVVKGVPNIGTNRLAYVGQALYISGQQLGTRIKCLIPGGGEIAIFIATPGSGNIQPRYDGAVSVLGSSYTVHEVATGAATGQELSAEKAFLSGHKTVKGAFAVDAGSTELLGEALSTEGLTHPERWIRHHPDHAVQHHGREDRLHHLPGPVPAGLPAHAVHLPVQHLGRHDQPVRHRHRPDVHHQVERPAIQQEQPVPGLDCGAEVHRAPVRRDQQPDRHHEHVTAPASR